jgi:exonuclease 3'-5' domain-containing protein 1
VVHIEDTEDLTKKLAKSTLQEAYDLIDTVEAIPALIEDLTGHPTEPPSLYLDLEGVNLSRDGSISILQIHIAPLNKSYLIDVHTLGVKAFNTPGKLDHTLRSILQSELIPKVFFDVRNDSDALFSHFQISLAGVKDLQVMEYATRTFQKKFLNGLSKCIDRDLGLSYSQKVECQRVKEKGLKLFAPERGGTYEVFNKRPLSDDIGLYCVQDVQWLPALYQTYKKRLNNLSQTTSVKVARASLDRVKESQSVSYSPHGQHKAIGPW